MMVTNQETTQPTQITPENLPLDFVKQYLRVDHNFDDVEITIDILAAQSYVRNHIKQPIDVPMDCELLIPTLSLIAYFYENKSPNSKSTEKLDSVFSSILNLHRRDIL